MKSLVFILASGATVVFGGSMGQSSVTTGTATRTGSLSQQLPTAPALTLPFRNVSTHLGSPTASAMGISKTILPEIPSDWKDAAMYCQNFRRIWHGVAELEWNDELASKAQENAHTCKAGHDMLDFLPGFKAAGQNTAAWVTGNENIPGAAICGVVDTWYKDSVDKGGEVLNFRNMISKDNVLVGCGHEYCPSGSDSSYRVVCNYQGKGDSSEDNYPPAEAGAPSDADTYQKAWGFPGTHKKPT